MRQVKKLPFAAPLPPSLYDQRVELPDRVESRLEVIGSRFSGAMHRIFTGQAELRATVALIEAESRKLRDCTQAALDNMVRELRKALLQKGFTRDIVAASFALIRETSFRILGMYHYPCQLFGGLALLNGKIAEMDTGEGKTLTATLPVATAAMARIPVHVVSVNDYLTARDAELMTPLYQALGLRVGCVTHNLQPAAKRVAYGCDITYVTNKELVFDYLRDRLTLSDRVESNLLRAEYLHSKVQRSHHLLIRGLYYAVVDEADSILVDEARTPLIISGTAGGDEEKTFLQQALAIAGRLSEGRDFRIDGQRRTVHLTAKGRAEIEVEASGLGPLWNGLVRRESTVYKALQALHLFRKDEHYLVRDGKVLIVDEFTGRVMDGRSWEQGLHQMIEMKENCELTSRRETLAKISYQRFFRRYLYLAGMTGTAREVAGELWNVYGLSTLKIPTNKPSRRRHFADRIFRTETEKWAAVTDRILQMHTLGRPVLVGTRSVKDSEKLSALIRARGVEHLVLNAKQDAAEAEIVKLAGAPGAVTIATNMAGRGTDIKLVDNVAALGGLHVIASERHEAGRIDRQLAGRTGRQGDPGSYEALLSFDDMLFVGRTGKLLAGVGRLIATPHRGLGVVLARLLVNAAQRRLENYHGKMRKELFKQDQAQGNLLSFSGKLE